MKLFKMIRTIDVMDPDTKELHTLDIVKQRSNGRICALSSADGLGAYIEASDSIADYWKDRPGAPIRDWQAEVRDGQTRLGYHEWADKVTADAYYEQTKANKETSGNAVLSSDAVEISERWRKLLEDGNLDYTMLAQIAQQGIDIGMRQGSGNAPAPTSEPVTLRTDCIYVARDDDSFRVLTPPGLKVDVMELDISNADPERSDRAEFRLLRDAMDEHTFNLP